MAEESVNMRAFEDIECERLSGKAKGDGMRMGEMEKCMKDERERERVRGEGKERKRVRERERERC